MRRAVALLAMAGCDKVFGLNQLPLIDAAPRDTVRSIDAFACVPQIIHDDFSGSATCDGWGNPTGPAGVEGNGMLVVTPVASTSSQGGCVAGAPVAFGGGGLFLKIPQVLDPLHEGTGTGGTFVFFRTTELAPGDGVTLMISAGATTIGVAESTTGMSLANVAYDPVAMLWWRIRPDSDLGAVVAETSPDGFTWQPLATAPGKLPTSVSLEFTGGEYGNGIADPGMAVFEDFNICP